jgi:diguanylate cyclase (GGDEF)-like protein
MGVRTGAGAGAPKPEPGVEAGHGRGAEATMMLASTVERPARGRAGNGAGAGAPKGSAGAFPCKPRGVAARWAGRAATAIGALMERVPAWRAAQVAHRLNARLAEAAGAVEVREALVEAARRLARADHAELLILTAPLIGAEPTGRRSQIAVPLKFAGRVLAVLRLWSDPPRRWSRATRRRLGRLAPLAAAALRAIEGEAAGANRGAGAGRRGGAPALPVPADAGRDPVTGLPGPEYLDALLRAGRGRRATDAAAALLIVAPDELRNVRRDLGTEFAEAAMNLAARAVRATLRSSDPVVRLDADRLAVVLPGAAKADARRVADALRRAVAEAGITASTPRPLTATVGVACLPDDASDATSLRGAAESALALARVRNSLTRAAAVAEEAGTTDSR